MCVGDGCDVDSATILELLERARAPTGVGEKTALIHEGLRALEPIRAGLVGDHARDRRHAAETPFVLLPTR